MIISVRGVVAVALALAVAAGCIRLGFWQLDRLEQRRERNAALRHALSLPPMELRDSLRPIFADPRPYLYRRVSVRGIYEPTREVVLRGRAAEGRPGVHLVTPLRVAGDTAVMVNRGWAPSPDAVTIDPRPLAEPGPRVVEGILLSAPPSAVTGPTTTGTAGPRIRSYPRLPLEALRESEPFALLPLYVQQLPTGPATDSLPRRVPLPDLGEGPHLGYAVQWFGFAAIALVGVLTMVWRGRRNPS